MALVTGGTITVAGGYRIHRFTADDTLVVSGGSVVIAIGDVFAVAGGGGAGSRSQGGGGGGAGGSVVTNADVITLTPGTYAVTIGNGGAGGPADVAEVGENGGNTTIFSVTAVGGGGGGSGTTVGGVGGGGATLSSGAIGDPGAATSGGFTGGIGAFNNSINRGSGGGAGANGDGGDAPVDGDIVTSGGAGGAGLVSAITGTSETYGVGGAGSVNLASGGGVVDADVNTGNGGPATTTIPGTIRGGNGGSGVAIVRYLTPEVEELFPQLSYVYPQSPANRARDRFRGLIQRARTATNHDESLRIAIFGDSTWTVPGGLGTEFMYEFIQRLGNIFGNVAGTQALGIISATTTPYVFMSSNGRQDAHFDATYQPPSLSFGGLPASGEETYPPNFTFDVDNARFASRRLQMAGLKHFPTANQRLEIYAVARDNSCPGIAIQYRPTNAAFSVFESQVGATEILNVPGVDQNLTVPELIRVVSNPYTPTVGKFRPVWFLRSSEDTTVGTGTVDPIVLAGVRVLNENPIGAIVDSYSAGGYKSTSWLGDTAVGGGSKENAIDVVAQIPNDVWIFSLGFNDFYSVDARSAANVRRNYYDVDGAVHRGMVGELIAARQARGLSVPLLVFLTPAFRADEGAAGYAAAKAEHELLATELQGLVDELQAAGFDALMRDVKAETDSRGFNATINDFQGCTVRGAYDTDSVEYAVDDIYTGTDGVQYRCLVAHTSSTARQPTEDGTNSASLFHRPVHVHLRGEVLSGLTGTDVVHHSRAGATLIAESLINLFVEHAAPASTQLSPTALAQVVAAFNVDATQTTARTNAATAATEATAAHVDAEVAATQATEAATEIGKVPRLSTAIAAGAPARRTKVDATSTTLDETLGATP